MRRLGPGDVFSSGVDWSVNPHEGKTIRDAVIEVDGEESLDAGGAAEVAIPPGAKVVDFGDRFVIPGLIDTHGHLYSRTGLEWRKTNPLLATFYLAAGVTSVGDPGSMDFAGDVDLREKIDTGQVPGPAVLPRRRIHPDAPEVDSLDQDDRDRRGARRWSMTLPGEARRPSRSTTICRARSCGPRSSGPRRSMRVCARRRGDVPPGDRHGSGPTLPRGSGHARWPKARDDDEGLRSMDQGDGRA